MRLLLVSDREFGLVTSGGAETVIHYLKEYFSKDNVVASASSNLNSDYFIPHVAQSFENYFVGVRDPAAYIHMYRTIRKFKPDVIHFHNFHLLTPSVVEAAEELEIPMLHTFHDLQELCPSLFFKNELMTPCESDRRYKCKCEISKVCKNRMLLYREIFERIPTVCYSEDHKKKLLEFGFCGDNISIIKNGIDPNEVPLSDSMGKYIVWSGAAGIKGSQYLPDTLAISKISFKLKLFSTWVEESNQIGKSLEEQRENLMKQNMSSTTKFFEDSSFYEGYNNIARKDFLDILSKSSGFLYTILSPVPGLVILETMAAQRPVVAFKHDNQEILEKEGCLFIDKDPKSIVDGVEYLIDNEETGRKMGEHNRKIFMENYTSDIMCKKYEVLYKRILNE